MNSHSILCFLFLSLTSFALDPRTPEKCLAVLTRWGGAHFDDAVPTQVGQVGTHASSTVPVFREITSENLPQLFTHQFSPNSHPHKRGAKGIVYQGIDGKTKVLMWPTGEDSKGNSIHHRDAVASVLEQEAAILEKLLEKKETVGMLNLQIKLETVARELSQVRKSETIPDGVVERFSGFQMTAFVDPKTGKFSLKSVDLDSSLTSAQISRGIKQTVGETQEVIDAISAALSLDVRPEEYRVEKSRLLNLSRKAPLRAPPKSRLGTLP